MAAKFWHEDRQCRALIVCPFDTKAASRRVGCRAMTRDNLLFVQRHLAMIVLDAGRRGTAEGLLVGSLYYGWALSPGSVAHSALKASSSLAATAAGARCAAFARSRRTPPSFGGSCWAATTFRPGSKDLGTPVGALVRIMVASPLRLRRSSCR